MPLPFTYFVKTSTIVGAPSDSVAGVANGRDPLGCALSNASYDHTGGGSGERQLTAASGTPFTSVQAGDYIYLLNAAGGVADGLYEIASVPSSTVILLSTDSGLTADSTADVDSSVAPWATLQYAFDQTITTGSILVICNDGNGSPNWTPSVTLDVDLNNGANRGIVYQGGSSRGVVDGTVATISGSSLGASTNLITVGNGIVGLIWADLRLTAATSNNFSDTNVGNNGWQFIRCRFDNATGAGLLLAAIAGVDFYDCEMDHNGTQGVRPPDLTGYNRGGWRFYRCRIHHNTGSGVNSSSAAGMVFINCAVYRNGSHGVVLYRQMQQVQMYGSVFFANTGSGVHFDSTAGVSNYPPGMVLNCVFRSNTAYGVNTSSLNERFIEIDNCCFHNNTSGTTSSGATMTGTLGSTTRVDSNIYSDPLFVSETDGSEDFDTQATSPLLGLAREVLDH